MPVATLETASATAGGQPNPEVVDDARAWTHHPHLHLPRIREGARAVLSASAPLVDKWAWRRRIRADPRKAFFYRIVIGIVGTLLIIAGPLTSPLPGPGGTALVILGLAVWASEFSWAKRLMTWFKAKVHAYRLLPLGTKAAVVMGIVALIGAVWYGALMLVGVPSWVPDQAAAQLLQLPGVA